MSKINWPYLDFQLQIPLLYIHTEIMRESLPRLTTEYIGIYIKLWKWQWRFRLYRPGGLNG